MILDFHSEEVSVEITEFNVLIVGFYAEENYLMIQQNLGDNGELANSLYHIERDDQSYGNYGGVEHITLSENQIEVLLDENGKEFLECDGIKVNFETSFETYSILVEKLELIFKDSISIKII